jgi:hypothetical protein
VRNVSFIAVAALTLAAAIVSENPAADAFAVAGVVTEIGSGTASGAGGQTSGKTPGF